MKSTEKQKSKTIYFPSVRNRAHIVYRLGICKYFSNIVFMLFFNSCIWLGSHFLWKKNKKRIPTRIKGWHKNHRIFYSFLSLWCHAVPGILILIHLWWFYYRATVKKAQWGYFGKKNMNFRFKFYMKFFTIHPTVHRRKN